MRLLERAVHRLEGRLSYGMRKVAFESEGRSGPDNGSCVSFPGSFR